MLIFAIVIFVLIIVVLLYTSYKICDLTYSPNTLSYDDTIKEFKKINIEIPKLEDYAFEDISIKSDYGYDLKARWLRAKNSKKVVILVHGFSINMIASLRYIDIFTNKGYNVLMYDHRFHGQSGGEFCSMGYYEKFDLVKCIDWAEKEVGKEAVIGLHGESMGGATCLLAAAIDNRVSFVIADCAYKDFYTEAKFQLKKMSRAYLAPFVNLMSKIKLSHSYKDISPIATINDIKAKVLFIHGDIDEVTQTSDSTDMYNAFKGQKEIFIAKNTKHGMTIHNHKKEYYDTVYRFLNEE